MTLTGAAIVVLAAGRSRRMRGRDKLMETINGTPLLRHVVDRACAVEVPVIVTLPPHSPRHDAIRGTPAQIVPVDGPMSGSLRAGVRAASPASMVLVALADMPDITSQDMRRVLTRAASDPHGRIHRGATTDGQPGHPVALPPLWATRMAQATGDQGAKSVISGAGAVLVPLPGDAAITDLDTPEAWQAWRQRNAISD